MNTDNVFREDFHIDYDEFSRKMDDIIWWGTYTEIEGYETDIDTESLGHLASVNDYDPHANGAPVISLRDVTAREADQAGGAFQWWIKELIIRGLVKSWVKKVEAGFACDADLQACENAPWQFQGTTISLLTVSDMEKGGRIMRLDDGKEIHVPNFIDLGHQYLSAHPDPVLHIFYPTQDHHVAAEIDPKWEMSLDEIRASVCERVKQTVSHASEKMRVEWSPEVGVDTDPEFLLQTVRIAITNWASIINVPDTRGWAEPWYIEKLFKFLHWGTRDLAKKYNFVFSCHNHNDNGRAVENSLAAVRGWATDVEVTLAGLGEGAGNASTHQTLVALQKAGYEIEWDVDRDTVARLEEMVRDSVYGETVPPHSARASQDGAWVHKARHWRHDKRSEVVGSDPWGNFYRDGAEYCRERNVIEVQNLWGREQIVESLKLFGIHHSKKDPEIVSLYTFFCNSTQQWGEADEKSFNIGETTLIQRVYPHNVYTEYMKRYGEVEIWDAIKNGKSGFRIPLLHKGEVVHELNIQTTQQHGVVPATIEAIEAYLGEEIDIMLVSEESNALPTRKWMVTKYRDVFGDIDVEDEPDPEEWQCYAEVEVLIKEDTADEHSPKRISRVRWDVIEQTYARAIIESCFDQIHTKMCA